MSDNPKNLKFFISSILIMAAITYAGFADLLTRSKEQIHLEPTSSSLTMQVVNSLMLAATIVAVAFPAVRWKRLGWETTPAMRWKRFDWEAVFLWATLPLVLVTFLFGTVIWLNTTFDDSAEAHTFVVTDAFYVDYKGPDGQVELQCLALGLPEELGTNRLWFVSRRVNLEGYPIGRQVKATSHDGFLGIPWCDIYDPAFTIFGRLGELETNMGRFRASVRMARGRFSPDSDYRRVLQSWAIPVEVESDSADETAD